MGEPEQGAAPAGAVPTPGDLAPRATARHDGTSSAASAVREVLTTGDVPATGDDAVDEALRRLVDVEGQDLRTQAAVFDDVHGALQDRLADAEG